MTWATSVPILVFVGLSVLALGPMYATDRQMSDALHHLMSPTLGAGHNNRHGLLCHKTGDLFGKIRRPICGTLIKNRPTLIINNSCIGH